MRTSRLHGPNRSAPIGDVTINGQAWPDSEGDHMVVVDVRDGVAEVISVEVISRLGAPSPFQADAPALCLCHMCHDGGTVEVGCIDRWRWSSLLGRMVRFCCPLLGLQSG